VSNNAELLSKLFKWKKHIQYEGVDFYLRIVGDQTIEDTRQAALVESRKARRALRDKASNEYLIHLDPMHDLDDEELMSVIVLMAARDVYRDYTAVTPKQIIEPLQDNPTLEEQEQYQEALETRDKEYIQHVQDYVEQWRVKFMEGLQKAPREILERQYAKYRTDRVCEEVFNRTFEDHLVAASVYTDSEYTKRAFTYDEFRSLPNEVREVFRDAYTSMNIEPDDLKN